MSINTVGPDELQSFMDRHGLSVAAVALYGGTSYDTASRAIAAKTSSRYRPLPRSAWIALQKEFAMFVDTDTDRARMYWGPGTLPVGGEMIGTVQRKAGDVGALIHLPTGYWQGNAGALRSLDRAEVEKAMEV
jgi:hypothetical protein